MNNMLFFIFEKNKSIGNGCLKKGIQIMLESEYTVTVGQSKARDLDVQIELFRPYPCILTRRMKGKGAH